MERNHDLIALIVLCFVVLITVLLHNDITSYNSDYGKYNIPQMEYNDIDAQVMHSPR